MPLVYQHRIYRQDLKRNPKVLYVFGDNAIRKGMGGQAGEMRGEPNAVGVATKWAPTMKESAFFTDDRFNEQRTMISDDLKPVLTALGDGIIVVWPSDGIGSGLSEVPTRAPLMWLWMEKVRERLEMV